MKPSTGSTHSGPSKKKGRLGVPSQAAEVIYVHPHLWEEADNVLCYTLTY